MPDFRTLETSDPALAPEGFVFVTVKSEALGRRADLTLYAPRQALGRRGLPLVLLLHGVYGSHWAWAFKGGAHRMLQALVDAGDLPPLVLAMPSDGLWGDGSGYVRQTGSDAEAWIVDEVPAAAALAHPGVQADAPLALVGLSMGGFAALRLAGRHPRRFVACAAHSAITEAAQLDALMAETRQGWPVGGPDERVLDSLLAARQAGSTLPPLSFDCGLDDPLLDANRALRAALQQAGVPHHYAEHPGGHDWAYWQRHLADSLRAVARHFPLQAGER